MGCRFKSYWAHQSFNLTGFLSVRFFWFYGSFCKISAGLRGRGSDTVATQYVVATRWRYSSDVFENIMVSERREGRICSGAIPLVLLFK